MHMSGQWALSGAVKTRRMATLGSHKEILTYCHNGREWVLAGVWQVKNWIRAVKE